MYSASIIIPCYNRPEIVRRCLFSLFNKVKDVEFEVIVVDDGSMESLIPLFKEFPNLSYIDNTKNLGISESVNNGIFYSKNDIKIKLDSDMETQDGSWVKEACLVLETFPEYGLVGDNMMPLPLEGEKESRNNIEIFWQKSVVNGGCFCISPIAFKKHGYMYSCPQPYGYDDGEYCYRIKFYGMKLGFLTTKSNPRLINIQPREEGEYRSWKNKSFQLNRQHIKKYLETYPSEPLYIDHKPKDFVKYYGR